MTKPKSEWKKCERCGKRKPDARRRPDDYAREINEEPDATWVACNECDQENRDDI